VRSEQQCPAVRCTWCRVRWAVQYHCAPDFFSRTFVFHHLDRDHGDIHHHALGRLFCSVSKCVSQDFLHRFDVYSRSSLL